MKLPKNLSSFLGKTMLCKIWHQKRRWCVKQNCRLDV